MNARIGMGIALVSGLVCALAGCDTAGTSGDDVGSTDMRTVEWELEGLESLGEDYVYEGWIVTEDGPISTGRFTVDGDGSASLDSFEVDAADADRATKFVLTIEPAEGDDPAPSATKLMGGDFADGSASLSIADEAALGSDFVDATAQFLIETPTSEPAEDYANGIWFLDADAGTPSIDLPELPEGWAYEGWVVTDDGPLTTGRFTSASGEDSDGAGPTAGPLGFPKFPGQDFIDPAMSLLGTTVVISIEPEPDDAAAPFLLKPLVMPAVEDVPDKGLQDMENNAIASSPTGTARIR
ncbi:MAG: anti-sigma factor [Myxococcota bacterium]